MHLLRRPAKGSQIKPGTVACVAEPQVGRDGAAAQSDEHLYSSVSLTRGKVLSACGCEVPALVFSQDGGEEEGSGDALGNKKKKSHSDTISTCTCF